MSGVSRTTAASGDKCKAGAIIVPELELGCSTVEDHCTALRKCGRTFFWWYMGTGKFSWNYTVPFRDGAGGWWYQVKPGLCWPVDFLGKIDRAGGMPLTKKFLGYQHLAAEPGRANSRLVINVIEDLRGFDAGMIDSKRRNIRAGARACVLEVLTRPDAGTLAECSALWNGFSARTGWKSPVPVKYFAESWSRMM
ncbi:MAG TPA: hypothetical protein VJM83_06135, partial [Nitrospirota bacterium]|nr:hypothetical protein [Nitrospirota bacterium]